MHTLFWVLWAAMLVYAAIARPQPTKQPLPAEDGRAAVFHWLGLAGGGFLTLGLVIAVAGFVNGERRDLGQYPLAQWAWTEGPFPARSKP